ncbi:MAG: flagellar basal body P-ring formation chaperone FlgA [Acidobacteriota bacterium]
MRPLRVDRRLSLRMLAILVASLVAGGAALFFPADAQAGAAASVQVPPDGSGEAWWRDVIRRHLDARLPVADARVEVVDVTLPEPLRHLPPATAVTLVAPGTWLRTSRVSLRVELLRPDGDRQTLWAAVRVHVPVTVPVAVARMQRGDLLGEDAVEFEERDLFDLRGRRPLTAADLGDDLSVSRTLAAGDPLTYDVVHGTPVVKQGQRIGLVVRQPGLTLRTTGVARKTAARGDVIPVSNADTGRIVTARVIDSRTAVVELAGVTP